MFRKRYPLFSLCIFAAVSNLFAVEIAPGRFPVNCGRSNVFVPYVSTHPIDDDSSAIQRIIVGIHSSGFDAIKCLTALKQAGSKAKGALQSTLIVCPQFLTVDSITPPIPDGLMAWKVSPYRGSSLACIGPQKTDIGFSAHNVMNQILTSVANITRFPNLNHVVVCGHSAGGQMTQRYAITVAFRPPKGVSVRFVASGASSYAYLNAKRPRQDGAKVRFEALTGDVLKQYPDYNKWGYGLDNMYRAFRGSKTEHLREQYATRRVLYLCGSRDNNPNDSTISKSYGAMLQGRNRLERMKLFFAHLVDVYGEDIRRTHAMGIASGVDHNGFDAYASPEGLKFLFDDSRIDRDGNGTPDWQEWLNNSE